MIIFICFASSFLIAITLFLTSNALGSEEGLIKIGVIGVPQINPKSRSLLFTLSIQFISLIITVLFQGKSLKILTLSIL